MRQSSLLQHVSQKSMPFLNNKKWKNYKTHAVEKKVFFFLLTLALFLAISGCAGKAKLDVGGSKIDFSKIDIYSSEIEGKIKKSSQNYEKNKLHKAIVGEPLVSKIKGYVQKCKALTKTQAGQYVTEKGKEYEIRYEDVEGEGFYVHVDCQGNYSDCGVGYYKIDDNGTLVSRHPYYDYYGAWYVVNDLSIKDESNHAIKKGSKIFEPLVSIRYSEEAYKSELVYSGISDDNLKIEYKEYASYFTTPSSKQNLSYTINKDNNIITYKDYKIKIVEATNQYVKYTVLSD
mgnify:CR=1 FL=1